MDTGHGRYAHHKRFKDALRPFVALPGTYADFEHGEERIAALGELIDLWDFAAYGSATTEALPDDDARIEMFGHWEGSHYKAALGNRVLAILFGMRDGSEPEPWKNSRERRHRPETCTRRRAVRPITRVRLTIRLGRTGPLPDVHRPKLPPAHPMSGIGADRRRVLEELRAGKPSELWGAGRLGARERGAA